MAGDQMTDPNGPLSWRDVYKAVEKSETSILAAIDAAVRPLTDRQNDHEQRIRSLEVHGSVEAQAALREIRALAVKHDADIAHIKLATETVATATALRIETVDDRLNAYDNREQGILSTISFGQKAIILLGAIIGTVLSFLGIVNIVNGGTF